MPTLFDSWEASTFPEYNNDKIPKYFSKLFLYYVIYFLFLVRAVNFLIFFFYGGGTEGKALTLKKMMEGVGKFMQLRNSK